MEPIESCAICGRAMADLHHLTGRGPDAGQLDPDLVVPLCHDDHELLHEDLRTEGLDRPCHAVTAVERVAHRLQRAGIFLARVAENVPPLCWLAGLAQGMRRWASELLDHVRTLDDWDSGWRLAPGVD